MSYFNNGSGAEVLEENNYYPFGLKHEGYNALVGNPAYQYKYNEKELQQETGWSDYGWRQYMPEIGKWNGMDQLSEKYYSTSPFAYVANNPISSFDVDGRFFNEQGEIDTSGYSSGFVNPRKAFMTQSIGQNPGEGGGGMTIGQLLDAIQGKSGAGDVDFSQFDFTKFGADNDEEPVNFFGKNEDKIYHEVFKQMDDLFKDTKGDGIFRVYGHGNLKMLWNEDTMIQNANEFDKAMTAKNKNWANIGKYKNPILILFACLSATDVGENGSMAKQISKAHPNLTVIGFRGFVTYDPDVSGIRNINTKQDGGDGMGLIVFYKNGRALSGYYYREFLKKYTNFK